VIFTLNMPVFKFTFRWQKVVQCTPPEGTHFRWDFQAP
jgi:hypothetical protein